MASPAHVSVQCSALLFDLDGVLIDSRASIERSWTTWAELKEIDPHRVLSVAHGRRTLETVQLVAPHLDAEREIAELARAELADLDGTTAMSGALRMLEALPSKRWAIVTSGLHVIATARLRHVGLPAPAVLVAADQIARGKPFPDGYVAAADHLGLSPAECIVLEDTPPGVAAARAAGMRVIAVLTTYPEHDLRDADHVVTGIDALQAIIEPDGIELRWFL